MKLVNLFVYGTLRPGGRLYPHWIEGAVVEAIEGVTVKGNLYHVSPTGLGYPVAKLDEPGTIHGTLLRCRPGSYELASTIQMEADAGYSVMLVEATVPHEPRKVLAKSFHYNHRPRGEQIVSGDWFKELARLG